MKNIIKQIISLLLNRGHKNQSELARQQAKPDNKKQEEKVPPEPAQNEQRERETPTHYMEFSKKQESENPKPVGLNQKKESKRSKKQRRDEIHDRYLDKMAEEKKLEEKEWLARRTYQDASKQHISNLPQSRANIIESRKRIFGNIENGLRVLIPYGGELSEAKRMYDICLDFLLNNPDKYYKIEIIELSEIDNHAVVAICGQWDEGKGLSLPWGDGKLDPSCDVWIDGSGWDNYKTRYFRNSSEPIEATLINSLKNQKLEKLKFCVIAFNFPIKNVQEEWISSELLTFFSRIYQLNDSNALVSFYRNLKNEGFEYYTLESEDDVTDEDFENTVIQIVRNQIPPPKYNRIEMHTKRASSPYEVYVCSCFLFFENI